WVDFGDSLGLAMRPQGWRPDRGQGAALAEAPQPRPQPKGLCPACARLLAVAPAGYLPTARTLLAEIRPMGPPEPPDVSRLPDRLVGHLQPQSLQYMMENRAELPEGALARSTWQRCGDLGSRSLMRSAMRPRTVKKIQPSSSSPAVNRPAATQRS